MKSIVWSLIFCLLSVSLVWAEPVDLQSNELHLVKSIETGTAAMQLRLDMIERAERSIEIEYFIFHKSDATRIFVEALLRKKVANPKIRIRLLIDYFAHSQSRDPFYTTALIEKGIEVKYYNPVMSLNLSKMSKRNHRKILLIDEREAIVGGRNMGDEYYDLKPNFNFMDRDVWVAGPITTAILESFDNFWRASQTKIPKKPRKPSGGSMNQKGPDTSLAQKAAYKRKLREAAEFSTLFDENNPEHSRLLKIKAEFKRIGTRLLSSEPSFAVKSVRFIADGPNWNGDSHTVTGPAYYEVMEDATKSIFIETPYFYLQKNEKAAFQRMKDRGVKIDLLLNSKKASNEFAINYITLLQGLDFSRMGFDLWLNEGYYMSKDNLVFPENEEKALWMVHAKTLITDNYLTWIGTLNMDPRSIHRLNAELALVVEDRRFSNAVRRHMVERQQLATKVEKGKVLKTGLNPAGHDTPFDLLRSSITIPYYLFENQI